jgi:hypothetical protein
MKQYFFNVLIKFSLFAFSFLLLFLRDLVPQDVAASEDFANLISSSPYYQSIYFIPGRDSGGGKRKSTFLMKKDFNQKAPNTTAAASATKTSLEKSFHKLNKDELELQHHFLKECFSFDKNLMVLEVSLLFHIYLTAAQAKLLVEAFIEKNAPLLTLLKLVSILWNSIIDLEYFVKYLKTIVFPTKYYDNYNDIYLSINRGFNDNNNNNNDANVNNGFNLNFRNKAILERLFLQECYHRFGYYNFWTPTQPGILFSSSVSFEIYVAVLCLCCRREI